MRRLALILLLVMLSAPVFAVTPDEILKDPALEARARHISQGLRCMVCQNQSIDDSDAPLAHDLRLLVRQRLEAGDSDKQVVDFIVARYGDFVLLKPPVEFDTLLLWGLPPAALLVGGIALIVAARRRRAIDPVPALSAAERARLEALGKPKA
jgi:cytochrome c-type biogenesis protein CcmH